MFVEHQDVAARLVKRRFPHAGRRHHIDSCSFCSVHRHESTNSPPDEVIGNHNSSHNLPLIVAEPDVVFPLAYLHCEIVSVAAKGNDAICSPPSEAAPLCGHDSIRRLSVLTDA